MKLHLFAIVALCGLLTMSCVEIYDCSDPKPPAVSIAAPVSPLSERLLLSGKRAL